MVAAEDGDVTIIIDGEGTCSALEARARCLGVWIRSSNL
jgi:positive regulator of sigma E activity